MIKKVAKKNLKKRSKIKENSLTGSPKHLKNVSAPSSNCGDNVMEIDRGFRGLSAYSNVETAPRSDLPSLCLQIFISGDLHEPRRRAPG